MYSVTRSNEQAQENPIGESQNNQIWVYGIISVIYFMMIGIVITVLLLAPKYRLITRSQQEDSVAHVASEKHEDFQIPEHDQYDEATEQPFIPSVRDPFHYDIDPRSSIFRGDYQERNSQELRDRESRMRINSKFLQM